MVMNKFRLDLEELIKQHGIDKDMDIESVFISDYIIGSLTHLRILQEQIKFGVRLNKEEK